MGTVDVVVVSYNSRRHLRGCVEPLAGAPGIHVVVVDNASSDGCLEVLDGLACTTVERSDNGGFAVGCNEGWRRGDAPYVLFLNPDARIDPAAVGRLASVLESDERVGAVGPLLLEPDGSTSVSQRRFLRLSHLLSYALFLHRAFPGTPWADDIVRDGGAYARPGSPDWLSGACLLVRRSVLERLDGLDERFFLYAEDVDLCRRIRDAGYDVRFEPSAAASHVGGASAPKDATLPLLARSQARYARKHHGLVVAALFRAALAAGFATHALTARGSRRGAYVRAAVAVVAG